MERVSNRFYAHLIKDGRAVSAILRCTNTSLAQSVDQAGVCTPNWNANEQGHDTLPLIVADLKLSGKFKPTTDFEWKWNGATITFNGNNSSGAFVQTVNGTSYPIFVKGTDANGMPTLTIQRNLARAIDNIDNDIISLVGSMESGGVPLGFDIGLPVRISEAAGSGWYGWIEGDSQVTENDKTANLTAHLKNGTSIQQQYTAKFYREGIDTDQSGVKVVQASSGVAAVQYTDSEITDNVVIRCDFYVDQEGTPTLVDQFYYNVDDDTDEMELQVSSVTYTLDDADENVVATLGTGQGDVFLREHQKTLFTFWMGHKMNKTNVYAGYTKFFAKLTDNQDKVINPNTYKTVLIPSGAGGNNTIAGDSGFVEITADLSSTGGGTDPVTAKGGKIYLTAQFLEANGDGVGGVVVAE